MKQAFTLAEILIVLVIIGVLTMILLPVAFQGSPDEDVLKFKKAYNTISTTVKELVSSDEYYQDGDLGIRKNGNMIDGTHKGDNTYFCESFSDIVSTKSINCAESSSNSYDGYLNVDNDGKINNWQDRIDSSFEGNSSGAYALDTMCEKSNIEAEIIFTNNIKFYQLEPECTFGITRDNVKNAQNASKEEFERFKGQRLFNNPGWWNDGSFDTIYKVFCIDINTDEKPFGIGIRADGKILNGARANEWLNKKIQKE